MSRKAQRRSASLGLKRLASAGSVMLLQTVQFVTCDFVYTTFDTIHGLTFVGSAGVSSCVDVNGLEYGLTSTGSFGSLPRQIREDISMVGTEYFDTSNAADQQETTEKLAGFGHRDDVQASPDSKGLSCSVRARIAPSLPAQAGALWYSNPLQVAIGFETMFTFQITDHSRVCTEHRDPLFSTNLHKTCSVRGGDGLAFVIQLDGRGLDAVGGPGADMGYGGIVNSLAVEFDTWYNPDPNSSDLLYDHVAVHSSGKNLANSWLQSSELSVPKIHELADGKEHLVRIEYFPKIELKYLKYFTATPNLSQYLMDGGESRRVGTLVIWMDEGVADDIPLVAIPLNLSILLEALDEAKGMYVGFTAGTGRAWAKHDILSWYWCNEANCAQDETEEWKQFDYHQTSQFNTKARYGAHIPGAGYGEGDPTGFRGETRHQSPDTDVWTVDPLPYTGSVNHFRGQTEPELIPPVTEN